jgi:hypothetical protein
LDFFYVKNWRDFGVFLFWGHSSFFY